MIPLQKKMAVEFVIDNEHQTPVKSYFSSARLCAVVCSRLPLSGRLSNMSCISGKSGSSSTGLLM